VLGSLAVIQRRSTPDGAANVAEAAENTLFRTWGGQTDALEVGGKIESGEIIHTDGAGAVLALADGSSLEMRADTELWLEHADDGLRIRLRKGGIIVDAAGMRGEHLYVQTKDMTASVVGTVFLVNAAEEGTRVAVIEGEVHVQQGASAQTLVRGEQVTTSPLMEPPPFGEDISWSRNAETHLVLLRQSIAPAAEEAFEIASVRPGPGLSGCGNFSVYITLDYFSATCATVYHLVDLAYGLKNCQVAQTLEPPCFYGGPAWARSDPFHIEAVLPHGSPGYTRSELQAGHAPKLQRMIQRLLVDRFKLTVHREMKGKKGKDAIAPAEILVITHLEKPTVN
jgi:hypothetical protein